MSEGSVFLEASDRSQRQRLLLAAALSLLFHFFIWQGVAVSALRVFRKKAAFIEITRVTVRAEAAQPAPAPLPAPPPAPLPPRIEKKVSPPKTPPRRIIPKKVSARPTPVPAAPPPPPQSTPAPNAGEEAAQQTVPGPAPVGEAYANDYDVPAQALNQVLPEIPEHLRSKEFKSYVRVRVDIEDSGRAVPSLRTSSGNMEIDNLVLAALRRWKWKPASRNGAAVSSTLYFKFIFQVK
jgi:protein TonB